MLPINNIIPDLLNTLESQTTILLQAPPGAGKTTRVPLALMDAPWREGRKILMLEPRRLAARSAGEKGFSVGAFDRAYLDRTPIALIRLGEGIVAFANLWQTGRRTRATLDLMRHVEDAPAGVMEFLFTELLLHFKAEGFAEFSLGNAPLSGLEARRGARLSTQLGAFVYQHGGAFYNFEGLRSFKDKFDPEWRPVYVAVPPRVNLVAVAADLVALIGGGVGRTLGRKPG